MRAIAVLCTVLAVGGCASVQQANGWSYGTAKDEYAFAGITSPNQETLTATCLAVNRNCSWVVTSPLPCAENTTAKVYFKTRTSSAALDGTCIRQNREYAYTVKDFETVSSLARSSDWISVVIATNTTESTLIFSGSGSAQAIAHVEQYARETKPLWACTKKQVNGNLLTVCE